MLSLMPCFCSLNFRISLMKDRILYLLWISLVSDIAEIRIVSIKDICSILETRMLTYQRCSKSWMLHCSNNISFTITNMSDIIEYLWFASFCFVSILNIITKLFYFIPQRLHILFALLKVLTQFLSLFSKECDLLVFRL